MNRPLHLAIALALSSSWIGAQTTADPETGWSLLGADLEVVVHPDRKQLTVSGVLSLELSGKASSAGPSLGINSRGPSMKWVELACAGAEVELGGRHPAGEHIRMARLRFPRPKSRGDRIEARFRCELEQAGKQLVVGPDVALASWVEAWYPVPAPPEGTSLGGASRVAGSTKFDLPRSWSAVSNGRLVSREETEDRCIEVWRTPRPLSRSFAAGPYRKVVHQAESLTASLYLLSRSAKDPRAHAEVLGRAIQAMEARWGPYPFQSFSIAEVPEAFGTFGASSEQGFILVKPRFLAVEGGNLPLFAHEAAHAWWGNTVGTDGPGSILCSESLAQYGAVLAIETLEGPAAATEFLRFSRRGYLMEQCARGYLDLVRQGGDVALSELESSHRTGHALSDSKGHWVWHMLRRRVGDELFFTTMRRLIRDFDGRQLTLAALRQAFVEAAPEKGLEQFFRQWLDRTGLPVILGRWKAGEARLEIEQAQEGEPYALDLDVELRLEGGSRLLRRVRTGAGKQESFDVQLGKDAQVEGVVLDPDHTLLVWHPDYGRSPVRSVVDDPVIDAAERAIYVGDYQVQGRPLVVRVVEREERLGVIVGSGKTEALLPSGEHRFRSDNGRLRFEVVEGRARSLEFRADDGRLVEARRE
jgi:hypothetical protein